MCVCVCISLFKAYVSIFLHMASHLSRLASLFLSGCAPHLANCQHVIYFFFPGALIKIDCCCLLLLLLLLLLSYDKSIGCIKSYVLSLQ